MTRATARWIRTLVNAHKQSSFQDKIAAMRAEPNPYYLLEWLVVPEADGDDAFWSAWEGERTPGAERGSLVGIEACFREQLPVELLVGAPIAEEDAALLATAFADLAASYGAERWAAGVRGLAERLEGAVDRYGAYVDALREETAKLQRELEAQLEALKAEAAEYEEGDFDLEAERRAAQAKAERKKQDLPAKTLHRLFPQDALVSVLATGGLAKPAERARAAAERLLGASAHPARDWAAALDRGDGDALRDGAGEARESVASAWLAAYMSRSELTRAWLPIEERQRAALRWIAAADRAGPWLDAAFRATGWEGRLAEPEFAGKPLYRFVWHALNDEERRKRLREELILQHWAVFAERFHAGGGDGTAAASTAGDDGAFEGNAWVFLLDPENVQQRLLRGRKENAESFIRTLCQLYAEGIRRGLDVRIVVSLYAYLAKHDREAFYSFVHGAKSIDAALPLMELPPAELAQLFRGDGVRQQAARKHLLQLFFAYLESEPAAGTASSEPMQRFASILSADKRAAVVGWLHRHERDWREWVGAAQERAFTKLLRFRWLGTAAEPTEQHRTVQQWLQRHSDWVQFETDAPNVEGEGVTYAILRPGAIDADTGEVLARATVRAEWSDRTQIGRLLDDLKSL
ncbi:OmpH family outer membrane protein [Paenibacillus sp.]|uniref:OmpH family outer membrane protein n=1 Tax=Paenibacillus sp. TaxID=58172 RepID=UPI002D693F9E|nr:OmpH family outer membrane protein [Paenibacillus sp.]HZG55469.1 OmpH family outer membrane protein [Paenibacillus sp.]